MTCLRPIGLLAFVMFCIHSLCVASAFADAGNTFQTRLPFRAVAITVPGTPWHQSWQILIANLAQTQSSLDLQPYIAGQLGSEENALSQLRRNRVQMGGFSLQGASTVVPELAVLGSPYLFDSFEEIDFVMDNYLTEEFVKLFAAKGLIFLDWAEVGWTGIYGSQPILSPSDSAGLKLRSSNGPASQLLIRSIGANPVPLPFPDIMPSLQTGLISGGETGTIFYALAGLPKEAPHLTLTHHAFDTGVYVANKNWFDGLPKTEQDKLRRSLVSAKVFRQQVRKAEADILAQPEKTGITVHQPTAEQLAEWRQATRNNYQDLIKTLGGDAAQIYEKINAGKKAFAEQLKQNK